MTNDLSIPYFAIRERFVGAAAMLTDDQRVLTVPACPGWSAHELLTHVVSMPTAILAGDLPEGGDPNPWLQRLVDENSHREFGDLAQLWSADDEALAGLVRGAGLLLADLFVHESDLHAAVGSVGHREAPELPTQLGASLAALQKQLAQTELAPICVDTGQLRMATSDGDPGWTLRCSAWEAHRALNSRRTREELLALEHDGEPAAYFEILHEHLPLPETTLGET